MICVDRLFVQLDSYPVQQKAPEDFHRPRPLSAYESHPALVILGEPGAGKTTVFQRATADRQDAVFIELRRFNRAVDLTPYRGKTLYIDALDEARSLTKGDQASVDRLVTQLETLGRPTFRLTCRSLDWYGSTDLRELADASSDGTVAVVALQPLSDHDIATVVLGDGLDGSEFVQQASYFGVLEIARNPENLRLLLEVIRNGAGWPTSRPALYEQASLLLLKETRDAHQDFPRGRFDPAELIDPAGRLCAIALCANQAGFAVRPSTADDLHPALRMITGEDQKAEAALHRRLFPAPHGGQVSLPHRTVAEYLAAKHISRRVREGGLPLTRALALLTVGGGTIANLRGLYGWLVALSGADAETLIGIDPLAVVQQGDVSQLPVATKSRIIELVGELGEERPWVLREHWAGEAFGALATPETEPVLRTVLSDPAANDYSLICVLEAIMHAPAPLRSLEDALRECLWNPLRSFGGRAVDAYARVAENPAPELRRLLDAVNEGQYPDDRRRLRGTLLMRLYPETVRPAELLQYAVDEDDNFSGAYESFLYRLVERTLAHDLPELFATLPRLLRSEAKRSSHRCGELAGAALVRALDFYGETADSPQLYEWLGVGVDEFGNSILEGDESKRIKEWFEARPRVVFMLLDYWRSVSAMENLRWAYHAFWERLADPPKPAGLGPYLMCAAVAEHRPELARVLFEEAALLGLRHETSDAPTLDELFAFVQDHPAFFPYLVSTDAQNGALTYQVVPEYKWKAARRNAAKRRRLECLRKDNLSKMPDLASICSGEARTVLIWAARCYWDRQASDDPERYIAQRSSPEVASAALNGFEALLHAGGLQNPASIGEAYALSQHWPEGYAVLAGCERLFQQNEKALLSVPDAALAAGLCHSYSIPLHGEWAWREVIATRKPDLTASALLGFWRPLFAAGIDHLPGLHAIHSSERWEGVAERIALPLLDYFGNCARMHLRELLLIGLRFAKRTDLQLLIERKLACDAEENKLLWLAAAAVLSEKGMNALAAQAADREDAANEALGLASQALWPERGRRALSASTKSLAGFAKIGCRAIALRFDEHGFYDDRSRLVRAFIERLASDPSKEATSALSELLADPDMQVWTNELRRAADVQAKNRREREFEWPAPERVASALDGKGPSSYDDLVALVENELRLLARQIRDGSTNTYRRFWDIAGDKVPRAENDARDHLLDLLKPRLCRFGIICEREGSFADDTRADIKIISGCMILPIEIKRHYHRDVWTAPVDQLTVRYSRDPAADGRGLYVVFWYGEAAQRRLPKAPEGVERVQDAASLENGLRKVLPDEVSSRTTIVCIDVAWPDRTVEGRRT